MNYRWTPLLLLLLACDSDKDAPSEDSLTEQPPADEDGDGFTTDDCDDSKPEVNPGATETCDGLDQDCDGQVDEEASDVGTWYADADSDGYGDPDKSQQACTAPSGFIAQTGDCDDLNAAVHPEADEGDCTDPIDYNCDGSVGYADADADGVPACEDCDDSDSARNPLATEVCNGLDDDCDGSADDADSNLDRSSASTWHLDRDADGHGDPAVSTLACTQPSGYSALDDDCDDDDGAIHPEAEEVCDSADNDCDGLSDDADPSLALSSASTWYQDLDGDGYGDADYSSQACALPSGYASSSSDCDDGDSAVSPSATEVCNSADDDCDGLSDDDDADLDLSSASTWHLDADGDGYGISGADLLACVQPSGSSTNTEDCDDSDVNVSPAGTETCDGVDEDCDGDTDNGVLGSGSTCPALTCQELLLDQPSSSDGAYWVQPDPTLAAFQAWCDMSTDDGGWTLLITIDPATVTYAYVADWPSSPAVTGSAPTRAGLYKGSLAAFSEVREEVASGKVKAYGAGLSEADLNEIRESYGYLSRMSASPTFADPPSCTLSYGGTSKVTGCSRYGSSAAGNTTTVIGWLVDPSSTYNSHCWFARGNCCSTSGGSSQCNGDPNGTLWARTWFR